MARAGQVRPERSRRTLDRIVGATEALLSERGAGDLTVEDVVARADTSVGAFYTRFDGKRVAVAFVRERSWDEVSTPDVVCEVIRRFVRVISGLRDHLLFGLRGDARSLILRDDGAEPRKSST